MLHYYGNESLVESVMDQIQRVWDGEEKKAILLSGFPGVGKTHLTNYVAQQLNVNNIVFNASAFRRKKEVNKISMYTQMKDNSIITLDECEGMKSNDLLSLLEGSIQPIVLCCNFIEEIDWKVKQRCNHHEVRAPPWWNMKEFADEWSRENGIFVPEEVKIKASKKAVSFRHLEHLLDDPDDDGYGVMLSKFDQVVETLRGARIEKYSMEPRELMAWLMDNSKGQATLSDADICLERAYLKGYRFWKYAYGLMGTIRSKQKVKYPYSFVMMGNAKRKHIQGEEKGKVEVKPRVKDSGNEIVFPDSAIKEAMTPDPKLAIEEVRVKKEKEPEKVKVAQLESWF